MQRGSDFGKADRLVFIIHIFMRGNQRYLIAQPLKCHQGGSFQGRCIKDKRNIDRTVYIFRNKRAEGRNYVTAAVPYRFSGILIHQGSGYSVGVSYDEILVHDRINNRYFTLCEHFMAAVFIVRQGPYPWKCNGLPGIVNVFVYCQWDIIRRQGFENDQGMSCQSRKIRFKNHIDGSVFARRDKTRCCGNRVSLRIQSRNSGRFIHQSSGQRICFPGNQ